MIGVGTMLASVGIDFVKDLIKDNGEDLVKEGIKKVTGIDLNKKKTKELTKEEIDKISANREAIMRLDFEKLKLELEESKEANRHEEKLRSEAHESYRIKNGQADKIADQIIKYNLPIIFLLVVINVVIVHYLKDEANLIAIASQIIGIAIGKLFAERQTVVNFFFGSSIGSKEKDLRK